MQSKIIKTCKNHSTVRAMYRQNFNLPIIKKHIYSLEDFVRKKQEKFYKTFIYLESLHYKYFFVKANLTKTTKPYCVL